MLKTIPMSEENKFKRTIGGLAKFLGQPDAWFLDATNILEQMPVALFVAEPSGLIKYANRRACKTFGQEQEQLCGLNIRELLPGAGADSGKPEHPGTVTVKSEELGCRKDGSRFPVSLHLRKIGPKEAQLTLIAVEDLSRERELEQLKHDFLAMISHDLRAPLMAVSGSISLLKDGSYGELPAEASKTLVSTGETVRRMTKLVNDLLLLEKLSSASFTVELRPASISEFIEPALAVVAPEADRRDITFVFKTAHLSDRMVLADKDRIIQVLVNLMSNAVKYSPDESTIEVCAEQENGLLKITVADKGPGIPLDARQFIFEKYKQLNEVRSGGVGLGLAICKLIIEQHKGTIGVDSDENQGSKFWFTIPISS